MGEVRNHPRADQPHSTSKKNVANVAHARIILNPCHKQKIPSQEMNLTTRTILRVLREDLGL